MNCRLMVSVEWSSGSCIDLPRIRVGACFVAREVHDRGREGKGINEMFTIATRSWLIEISMLTVLSRAWNGMESVGKPSNAFVGFEMICRLPDLRM